MVSVVGTVVPAVQALFDPSLGAVAIFWPQTLVSYGNGLLLPTAIAGAVSIRPQVAGSASGITGFIQMATGAVAVQIVSHAIAGAASPMPMLALMLAFALATAAAFFILARD